MNDQNERKIIERWVNHENDAEWPNEFITNLLKEQAELSYQEGRKDERRENIETAFSVANTTNEVIYDDKLKKITDRIASLCGSPNAGDGCRAILEYIKSLKKQS